MFNKVRQTQKIPGRKFCTFWRFCEEHMDLCQRMLEFWTQMNSSLGNRLGTILYTRQMSPVPSPLFMQSPELSPNLEHILKRSTYTLLSSSCPSPCCLQLTSCLFPQQTVKKKRMKTDEKSSETMKNCKCQHSSEEIASQTSETMEATKNRDN